MIGGGFAGVEGKVGLFGGIGESVFIFIVVIIGILGKEISKYVNDNFFREANHRILVNIVETLKVGFVEVVGTHYDMRCG